VLATEKITPRFYKIYERTKYTYCFLSEFKPPQDNDNQVVVAEKIIPPAKFGNNYLT